MANDTNTVDDSSQPDVTPEAVLGGLLPADVQKGPLADATPFVDAGVAPEAPDAGNAFSSLAAPTQQVTPNRYGEQQTKNTAMLGALAQQRTGLNDEADSRLGTLSALNQEAIEAGQEKQLRSQIALAARQNQVAGINNLQSKLLTFSDPALADTTLSSLIDLGIKTQNAPHDPDELEMQGVARLQTMGASDPDQAVVLQNLQKQGDVLDRIRDNVVKMQIFNREVDALGKAKAEQGFGKDALDFINGFIPLNMFFANRGNVDAQGTNMFTHLPSTVMNREVQTLFNMPLDEFRAKVPQVMMNMTKMYTMDGANLTQALATAQQFRAGGVNNTDALSFNVWSGVDVASVIPLDRVLQVPGKMARLLGNRATSADLSAAGIAAEIHGAPSNVASVQAPFHSIEESIPSSLVPDTMSFVRPDVGVPGDVADRLAQIKAGTDAARRAITTQDRLAPAQLREAVEAASEKARLEFRDDPIADIKLDASSVPDREPGDFAERSRGLIDPDADLDNLSYINARGEVYSGEARAEEGGYRTSAQDIAREHADDVTKLETDAYVKTASGSTVRAELAAAKRAAFAAGEKGAEVGGVRGDIALSRNPDTGIYSINMYLGKRYSSGGFITKEGAEAAAVRRGFALSDVDIHRNSDAQYFIKVKQAVTETGISSPVLREADFPDLGYFPRMSAAIKSADNIMPEMFNQARITQTIGKQKYLAAVVGPYVKNIKAVGPKGVRAISKVMQVGERDQKWFTRAEFEFEFNRAAGRMPSDKEVLAYYSAKELSDLNYHIFNNGLYAEKARRGMVTVSARNEVHGFDSGRMNGKVVENPDFTSGRIYDVDEGTTISGDTDGALKRKYESGNYRVLDLERPIKPGGEGSDPVKKLLVHNGSSTVGPLEAEQLGYVAGGSRENRFKWFVKQAQSGTFGDGKAYWLNPTTHVAARTGKQAREWAESMENARKAFFDTSMEEAEKRRIIELSPAESYEKFEAMVNDGTINQSHPFEALYDRQTPTAMNHLGDDAVRWVDDAETPEESYAISKGRMYYSKKGERLVDPNGDYAEIMDPFTTLHKAVNNAAQTFAFGDYNKKVVDEWARSALPYIDRKSVGNNWDSYNLFFNGKLSDDFYRANPKFANQLEFTRNTHKRLLGTQTPEQKMTYNAARRFADWVENKGEFGEKIAGAVLDRMSSNPVTAVRGMVFDAKLGFFDPGQLIVQTQTALMAMSVDPINGARTAGMLLPLSHLMVNQSENLLDYYGKSLKAIHGLDVQDFKTMIRSLRTSGWMNVGGDMMQLDQYMNTIGGSALARTVNQVREAGRIPFNMSEKFNRLTAYNIAWKSTREKFPALAGDSREFQQMVNKYADDLSMNMTSSSAAFWQKGVLSVPTQFLAYQARVLENILPKAFGGSPRFTGAQKMRLAVGQLFLYGAAGVPLGDEVVNWASQQYQNATGKQLDPETWRVLTKGFWDTALFYGTDGKLDTDFAQRAGTGAAWTQFFQKLTDGSMNNVLEVTGGPSLAVSGKMVDSIMKIATYMKAEQFGTLSAYDFEQTAKDLTSQISSLSRVQKAYAIWKYGMIKDPNSGEAVVQADRLATMAAALGVPLRQETEFWDRTRDLKNRDEVVRDYGKLIASNRREAFQAMQDGDSVKEHHYEQLATGLLMIHQDDPMLMAEIAKEANKQLNYSNAEWDSLVQRLYERTGQEPIGGK